MLWVVGLYLGSILGDKVLTISRTDSPREGLSLQVSEPPSVRAPGDTGNGANAAQAQPHCPQAPAS